MIIKVCGMRDADNIRELEQLSINMMGFIFYPKSSRYVSERPAYLPTHCKRVGVFVDADIEQVCRIADEYSLDYIQLHGNESPAYIQELHKYWLRPISSRLGQTCKHDGPRCSEKSPLSIHSKCIGIDLNSRFEIAPGLKDINKLKIFINSL